MLAESLRQYIVHIVKLCNRTVFSRKAAEKLIINYL